MTKPDGPPLLASSSIGSGSGRALARNESPWVAVFNLCNSVIGAGVLSFPYGFRKTGLVGGICFTALIWIVEVFSLCLLVRVAERYNSKSYQHLVSSVLGSGMAVVTSATILIFLYGCMISYLIITGDVFAPTFADKFGAHSILGSRSVVILVFAFVVILPLSLQTSLKALKYSSLITVIMLIYLTLALVLIGAVTFIKQGFPTDVAVFDVGISTFIIMDIVVFAFECHIQVVPIFAELADRPRPFFKQQKDPLEEQLLDEEVIWELEGHRSERVKRMDGIIFTAMALCFISYCLIGEFGYLLFQDVESDVLTSFGNSNFFMNVAQIGMGLVALACYPVQHFPARSIIDDAVKYLAALPAHNFSWIRHVLITLVFVITSLAIALAISDIGKVFSIVGATGGVMVVFIVPGVLLILGSHTAQPRSVEASMDAEEGSVTTMRSSSKAFFQIFGGTFIIVFGCVIFVATAYVTAVGLGD